MLVGRQEEIETIVQGLTEDKAHIVLYSERGRGKTSLVNIVVEALRSQGLIVVRHQCEAGSTFDSFMRGLMRNLPTSFLVAPAGPEAQNGCESAFPAAAIRPDDVVSLLPKLRLHSLTCVVDEFDRITDTTTRTMLADTIKQLSDCGIPLLFIIIGVSDSLEQLLGQHPSIQRNLLAVPLPLLSDEQAVCLVEKGVREAGLTIPADVVRAMVTVSRGMPYVTHLLGLRTAQAAARRATTNIDRRDYATAVYRLILEAPSQIVRRYGELTDNGMDHTMVAALEEVAAGTQDRWGHMLTDEVPGENVSVGGRRISWAVWLTLREVGVLCPCHGKPGYVTFVERALLQHILLQADNRAFTTPSLHNAPSDAPPRQLVFSGVDIPGHYNRRVDTFNKSDCE